MGTRTQKLWGVFGVCISLWSCAQQSESAITQKIERQLLVEDLIIFKEQLKKIHSGLYTYTSEQQLDSTFSSIKNSLVEPTTTIDFYRKLLPLHNQIRNGHTFIIPPESWSKAAENELLHFPFDIYRDGEKLYVLRNLSNTTEIEPGSELLTINNSPAIDVYWELVENWTKDGYNTTYPEKIVQQDFSEFFLNVYDSHDYFEVVVAKNGISQPYTVTGLPISELRRIAKSRYDFDKLPWYNDNFDTRLKLQFNQDVALLTIPTFNIDVIEDNGMDYLAFFKDAFKKITQRKSDQLVIDIRGNGGGHGDVASKLFSHLHDQPFELIESIYTITNKISDKKYYQGKLGSVNLQMKLALEKKNDTLFVPKKKAAKKNHLSLEEMTPSDPIFKGTVFVLMDGWSFSASGMFTALMTHRENMFFVGEEAGGNPHTQVGDFEQMLVLPNSGVRVRIPLFTQHMKVNFKNTGHGISPDFYVRNSITDMLSERDAPMDFLLNHIKTTYNDN